MDFAAERANQAFRLDNVEKMTDLKEQTVANQISNANISSNPKLFDPQKKQTRDASGADGSAANPVSSSHPDNIPLKERIEVDGALQLSRIDAPPAGMSIGGKDEAITLAGKIRTLLSDNPTAALLAHGKPGSETVATLLSRPPALES